MFRRARDRAAVAGITVMIMTAAAGPAPAAVNGFAGGDGDQAADCTATAADWQCLTVDQVETAEDAVGVTDDTFTSGSKFGEPDTWALTTGQTITTKSDIRAAWTAVARDAAQRNYLYVGFTRVGNAGDTFLGIELNQSAARWTNSVGTTIPCRTDGDVLISYEVAGSPVVKLFEWQGSKGPTGCPDGLEGSFTTEIEMPSPGREAAMNFDAAIQNFLSPAMFSNSFATATFGEAALDLQTLADAVDFVTPCQYFKAAHITTRSSTSATSALKDQVGTVDLVARACESGGGGGGGSVLVPEAPVVTHTPGGTLLNTGNVVIRGTAEPGTTITVYDNGIGVGFATTATDGSWSLVQNGLSDGQHSYTAEATSSVTGLTSATSTADVFTVDTTAPPARVVGATVSGNDVTLTCAAEAGSTVRFYDGAALVATVTASPGGSAQVVLAGVADGTHSYTCTAADAAGNVSAPSDARSVTVDTIAPSPPNGSGTTSGDTVTLACAAEPNSTVRFYEGDTALGESTADDGGTATLELSAVADGDHVYTCTATDAAGNTSAPSAPVAVTVDTLAPAQPQLDTSSNENEVILTCSAEAGSTVRFYDGDSLLGTDTADSDGIARLVLGDVADGSHSYTCSATDAAGNVSQPSDAAPVVIDTVAPRQPTLEVSSAGRTVTLTCATEPGSTVSFYEGAALVGTAAVGDEGVATLVLSDVAEGSHAYTCVSTDDAGNSSPPSDAVTVTVDVTPPGAPAIDATHSGGTVTITCRTEAAAIVRLLDNGVIVGTQSANADGAVTFVLANVSAGDHSYTCVATDAAGNASAPSPAHTVTVPSVPGPISAAPTRTGEAGPDSDGTLSANLVDMLSPGAKVACYAKPFTAYVRMKGVRRVRFRVDGRRLAVVRRPDGRGQYKARVVPSRYQPGMHKLTARITFRKRGRRAKTVTLRWRRCVDRCVSRRNFRIRVKRARGDRVVKAVVLVNGKRVKVVRGKRLRAPVRLAGLPKGVFRVRIIATLKSGRVIVDKRKYRTCTKRRAKQKRTSEPRN